MNELKKYLHLEVLTVTGKTPGENLEELEKEGFFKNRYGELKVFGIKKENIIRSAADPIHKEGSIAVLKGNLAPGDAVIIRYEGPRGSGMPELFYTTEAIASDPDLTSTTALITDGRFSGAT